MRLDHAAIVGKREYLTRVKSKGFWIATAVLPLFLAAMVLGPSLAARRSRAEQRLAIVDATGAGLGRELAAELSGGKRTRNGGVTFEVVLIGSAPPGTAGRPSTATASGRQRDELDLQVRDKQIGAWVWLTGEGLRENRFEYHAASLSNLLTQEVLSDGISAVVSKWRLRSAGFDAAKVAELTQPFGLKTVLVSASGSRTEQGVGGFMLAFGMCFTLYMVIVIYGSQVMQGVLEEKSSRVIEVIASAIRPAELMTGKLVGICLVALTQLAIWVAAALVLTAPGIVGALLARTPGRTLPNLPNVSPVVIIHLFLLFVIGFFLYSTLYAMIGASFNSVQEAQQFAAIAVVFIVPPLMFIVPIINDPDSALAVGMSLFPFFTPLVMMLRIASKMPPAWQIAAAYSICLAAIAGMVWLCARIYRVGILMYGKKPTLQEIWRWVRYT
jgi:ABC-2 type transport system permease protein